jgi:hypothetical protein
VTKEIITVENFMEANKDKPGIKSMRPAVVCETRGGFDLVIFESDRCVLVEVNAQDYRGALNNLRAAVEHS